MQPLIFEKSVHGPNTQDGLQLERNYIGPEESTGPYFIQSLPLFLSPNPEAIELAHPENWVRGHFFQILMVAPPECISRNPEISFASIWNCLLEKKMVEGPKNRFESCC